MRGEINALGLVHGFLEEEIGLGALCIDATAGRGWDTVFLAKLVGETGQILAFDVQQEALDSTRERLDQEGIHTPVELILDSHCQMGRHGQPGTVDGIVFNFGYLPGGDHQVGTRLESSILAIGAGLELLKPGGVMSLCIYYGGDSGFEERDGLLEFLPTLDFKKYTVLVTDFANRPNCPPIPVRIYKEG